MESKDKKPRIRAIPSKGSRHLTAAAILLLIAGAMMLLFKLVFAESGSVDNLFPLWGALLLLASGVLLFFCRDRTALFVVFCVLFIVAIGGSYGYIPAVGVLLTLLSAIGWRFNVVFEKLPETLCRPILNLLAAVAAIVAILNIADSSRASYIRYLEIKPAMSLILVIFAVLPAVALLLINLAMEPHEVEKRERLGFRTKAVLPEGGGLFRAAAIMLTIAGVSMLIMELVSYIKGTSGLRAPIFTALLAWAGILLLQNRERSGRLTTAMVLLALHTAYFHLGTGLTLTTFTLPVVLMLISAIGVTWNTAHGPIGKRRGTPLLNVIAAALLLVNLLISAYGFITALGKAGGAPWYSAILALLLPLSLLLLNLSLGSCEVARKTVDSKYRRGFAGLVQRIYSNVGGGLQTVARVVGIFFLCIATLSAAVLAFGVVNLVLIYVGDIYLLGAATPFLAGGAGLAGSIIMILGTWPLFAFGQVTADVRELKEDGGISAPEYFEENPDELPEL